MMELALRANSRPLLIKVNHKLLAQHLLLLKQHHKVILQLAVQGR